MLYLYKNKTPNIEKNLFYYFTDFQAYLTELGTPYLSFAKNSYQINNNVVTARTETINVDIDAITYIIDYDTNYYRCYHVTNAMIVSDFMYFDVAVDYWGSFIAKCSLENIVVNRCNRNIGTGVYDEIEFAKSFEKIRFPMTSSEYVIDSSTTPPTPYPNHYRFDHVYIVFVMTYNVSQSSFGSVSETSMFALPLDNVMNFYKTLHPLMDAYPNPIEIAKSYVAGIYGVDSNNTWGASSTNDARVIKAWIVPERFIQVRVSEVAEIKIKSIYGNVTYQPYDVLIKSRDFTKTLQIDADYDYYVGTIYKGLKINRETSTNIDIIYTCNVKNSDLEILVKQGNNQLDITSEFELELTTNDGDVTNLSAIKQALNSSLSLFAGVSSQNYLMTGISIAGDLTNLIGQHHLGHQVGNGDGILNFLQYGNSSIGLGLYYPFGYVRYKSVIDEKEKANRIGANFNIKIASIPSIFSSAILGTGTNETFIQADAIVKNVCTDAMQTIKNSLGSGIYVKYLSIS